MRFFSYIFLFLLRSFALQGGLLHPLDMAYSFGCGGFCCYLSILWCFLRLRFIFLTFFYVTLFILVFNGLRSCYELNYIFWNYEIRRLPFSCGIVTVGIAVGKYIPFFWLLREHFWSSYTCWKNSLIRVFFLLWKIYIILVLWGRSFFDCCQMLVCGLWFCSFGQLSCIQRL